MPLPDWPTVGEDLGVDQPTARRRPSRHRCRRLNPDSTLTRAPARDGTTATFNGMLSAPARNVMPAARTRPLPAGVRFGPIPNSAPSLVRTPTIQLRLGSATLCSRPPSSATHSVTIVTLLPCA